LVARQYCNGFQEVLGLGVHELESGLQGLNSLEGAIINCQLQFLAHHEDSLIKRKRGAQEAKHASTLARRVLKAGWPIRKQGLEAFQELDVWMRAEGNERNPGAVADLVAASLFVALRKNIIKLPLEIPWAYG
jgi:triphosphoribosyl-dephospho-CoA synthase